MNQLILCRFFHAISYIKTCLSINAVYTKDWKSNIFIQGFHSGLALTPYGHLLDSTQIILIIINFQFNFRDFNLTKYIVPQYIPHLRSTKRPHLKLDSSLQEVCALTDLCEGYLYIYIYLLIHISTSRMQT